MLLLLLLSIVSCCLDAWRRRPRPAGRADARGPASAALLVRALRVSAFLRMVRRLASLRRPPLQRKRGGLVTRASRRWRSRIGGRGYGSASEYGGARENQGSTAARGARETASPRVIWRAALRPQLSRAPPAQPLSHTSGSL
jgi:hypothetical protein